MKRKMSSGSIGGSASGTANDKSIRSGTRGSSRNCSPNPSKFAINQGAGSSSRRGSQMSKFKMKSIF